MAAWTAVVAVPAKPLVAAMEEPIEAAIPRTTGAVPVPNCSAIIRTAAVTARGFF